LKSRVVKDLMIPLSEYATVSEDATLMDAVVALRKTQSDRKGKKYLHRAVLVLDSNSNVVGKISMLDILRSLEPKYDEMISDRKSLHLGFTVSYQRAMIEQLRLWDAPMEHLCRKALKLKVASFATTPHGGEILESTSTLDEAIHLLVIGCHQSLLVMDKNVIVGVLRLTDVFETVADEIVACDI
jgi:predicted transcriptional regulator